MTMTDISRDQVVDYLSNLPVIQIAELIKTLEDKWGVKAAPAAVAMAASSLSVVTNANRLRRFSATPSRPPAPRHAPRPVVIDLEAPRDCPATVR